MATAEEIASLRAKITKAKDALDALVCGDKAEEVSFGESRRTRWTIARVPELRRYIADLESELALATGVGSRRPIYPGSVPR